MIWPVFNSFLPFLAYARFLFHCLFVLCRLIAISLFHAVLCNVKPQARGSGERRPFWWHFKSVVHFATWNAALSLKSVASPWHFPTSHAPATLPLPRAFDTKLYVFSRLMKSNNLTLYEIRFRNAGGSLCSFSLTTFDLYIPREIAPSSTG